MEFQQVIADSLINTVITRTRLHYPELTVIIEADKNIPPILGDAGRLAQVLENLISNAVKYAPDSDIAISARKEKEFAVISVKDHGPGIPEQYLGHLFERFYRIPNQAPNVHGSGLGLYICKQIVEAHHGYISANSIEGKGTSFDVRLPYKS
jgi:signal transduction histidine kinase